MHRLRSGTELVPQGYPINAAPGTLSAPSYYIFSFTNGTLTVNGGATQTITFSALPNVPFSVVKHETLTGLNNPAAIAVDGSGVVWVVNAQTAGSISQVTYGTSAPLSPPTGFGVLNQPSAIAVDGSGNIWTANSGDNTVSLFVGLASPTVTPLVATGVGP